MSDEFMPALTMEASEPEVVTMPKTGGDDPNVPPPDSTTAVRDGRVITDATRNRIRGIKEAFKASEASGDASGADDLIPMEHEEKPTPPAPKAPSSPSRAAEILARAETRPTAPAPAAVPPQPDATIAPTAAAAAAEIMARAEADQHRQVYESKVKELEAREKALAEREKKLPDRTAVIERPAAALSAYLREVYGVETDDEFKEVLADVVAELSESQLGVKLPENVKTSLESKKALRSVKAYKADLSAKEAALEAKRLKNEEEAKVERERREHADRERRAVELVHDLVNRPDAKDEFLYLHALPELGISDNPGAIVVEVIREMYRRNPDQRVSWKEAAKMANDHYRPRVEAAIRAAQGLGQRFSPATAAAAPAAAQPKPVSQVPGDQVPRPSKTLTAAPTAPTTPPEENEYVYEDRHDRRRRGLMERWEKHKGNFPVQQ